MEVANPISDPVSITTDIVINPADLTGLYYSNILNRLKSSLLKKCIRNGFVMHIYGIKEIKRDPMIQNENLSDSSMKIKLSFVGKICLPKVGDLIYAKVIKKNEKLCQAKLGPMIIVINLMNANLESFDAKLEVGKWIKVRILEVIFHIEDKAIHIYGNIEDIVADESIIKEYLKKINI